MSKDRSNPPQTRRNVLKKLGAGAAFPIANVGDTVDKTVRLPELRNREGVVRWTEVPKVWNAHRKRAERVAEKLKSSHGNRAGVVEVGITAAPERFGGKPGFEIEVGINPEQIDTEVPDQMNGISVRTMERTEPPVELCKNDSYSGLPGGVLVVNGNLDGSGTTGWQAEYNGKTVMMTAEHVVSDKDTVYADENSFNEVEEIGTVISRDFDTDVAAIESNRNIEPGIPTPDGTYPVGGWVTKSGISERVSDLFDGYQKMGNVTGQSAGGLGKYQIDDSYASGMRSFGGEGVKGDAIAAKGDSGAPAFSVHNGEAFVTHMIAAGDMKAGKLSTNSNCANNDPYKKSIGTAAYHLNNIGYQAVGSSRQ